MTERTHLSLPRTSFSLQETDVTTAILSSTASVRPSVCPAVPQTQSTRRAPSTKVGYSGFRGCVRGVVYHSGLQWPWLALLWWGLHVADELTLHFYVFLFCRFGSCSKTVSHLRVFVASAHVFLTFATISTTYCTARRASWQWATVIRRLWVTVLK